MPTVKVNDINMYYEVHGEGVPLVLIMGFTADHAPWEEQIPIYSKEYKVVVFDNRGVGQTDKPDIEYTMRMMAADTVGLMDKLGIGEAHVAGLSMGGAIAQEVAINYPERVRSLVLHATWPKSDPYFARTLELLKMLVAREPHMSQVYQDILVFTPEYYNANQDRIRKMQEDTAKSENPMPAYAVFRQADAIVNHNAEDRLYLIKAPTLITVGDQDIWTPLRFAKVLHAKIPHSQLIIEKNAPHASLWEDPEGFAEMTLKFLREH